MHVSMMVGHLTCVCLYFECVCLHVCVCVCVCVCLHVCAYVRAASVCLFLCTEQV